MCSVMGMFGASGEQEIKALTLFSGIGGLDIAAHAAGIETVAFCEIEPFACRILERRFPGVENLGNVMHFTNRRLRELGGSPFIRFKCPADYAGAIDVVHGGFPCQDLSVAGKQRGLSGDRSGLWFEMVWRQKATKCGAASFQLLRLERRTEGKGSSCSGSGAM